MGTNYSLKKILVIILGIYLSMENKAASTDYHGELSPASDFQIRRGAVWFMYHHQQRLYPETYRTDKRVAAGMRIAASRHKLSLGGYSPRFRLETIRVTGVIGSGLNSRVWKANFGEGEQFAVKQLKSHILVSDVWKERDMLILLRGPRVINLVGAFFEINPFLIMELCYAPLSLFITKLSPINQTRFVLQLIEAILWIHSKDVIHCSIHPENCLITTSNNLVLAGFNTALHLKNGCSSVESETKRGNYAYQDYECNELLSFSKVSDMFSLGCVLFEILSGKALLQYKNKNIKRDEYALALKVGRVCGLGPKEEPTLNSVREPISERVEKANRMKNVLVQLVADREHRLTAEELCSHSTILAEYERLARNNWKYENGDDLVTCDFVTQNLATNLETFSPHDISGVSSALTGIYYDETEQMTDVPNCRRALNSYETHVVAEAFVKQNMVSDLVLALAEKDPSALGSLETLVSGYLERHSLEVIEGQNDEKVILDLKQKLTSGSIVRILNESVGASSQVKNLTTENKDITKNNDNSVKEQVVDKPDCEVPKQLELQTKRPAKTLSTEIPQKSVVNLLDNSAKVSHNSTLPAVVSKSPGIDPFAKGYKIPKRKRELTPPPKFSGAQPEVLTTRRDSKGHSTASYMPSTLFPMTSPSVLMPPPPLPRSQSFSMMPPRMKSSPGKKHPSTFPSLLPKRDNRDIIRHPNSSKKPNPIPKTDEKLKTTPGISTPTNSSNVNLSKAGTKVPGSLFGAKDDDFDALRKGK